MNNTVMVRFTKYECETAKAYLVKIHQKEYWFPKKLCWNLIINKKLGGHLTIPEWLYREKFGQSPPEEDLMVKITKHKPEKIKPISDNTINDLKK